MAPKSFTLLALLGLAACFDGGGSQIVDGTRYSVVPDDSYYWPAPTRVTSPTGAEVEVEPFPLVSALVVSRSDGAAMTGADESAARRAATAHCASQGKGPPSASGRLADGAWAFYPCG